MVCIHAPGRWKPDAYPAAVGVNARVYLWSHGYVFHVSWVGVGWQRHFCRTYCSLLIGEADNQGTVFFVFVLLCCVLSVDSLKLSSICESASQAVLGRGCRSPFMRLAQQTPHCASRLVRALSACSVKNPTCSVPAL